MADGEKFDLWCLVNLFGHQRLAGRVSEQLIGGQPFIRIDVPAVGDIAPFTRFLGAGSIYSIDPVSETVARGAAEFIRAAPISVYEMPPSVLKALQQSQQRSLNASPQEEEERF